MGPTPLRESGPYAVVLDSRARVKSRSSGTPPAKQISFTNTSRQLLARPVISSLSASSRYSRMSEGKSVGWQLTITCAGLRLFNPWLSVTDSSIVYTPGPGGVKVVSAAFGSATPSSGLQEYAATLPSGS